LRRLGAQGTFDTVLRLAPGTLLGDVGIVRGDLVLVGGGDPTLDDVALRGLAKAAADRGIVKVTGGVLGDGSLFDPRRGGPRTGFRPDVDMGGWLGGLTWGHGRAYPGGDPALVAATRLHGFLKGRHIKLGRRPRVVTATAAQEEAPGLDEIARTISAPLSSIVTTTNQGSDNFYAETLVKYLGARLGSGGTTAGGLSVVRGELKRLGVRAKLADGSGLSRANRIAPSQLTRLLTAMSRDETLGPTFTTSLARFGQPGTLKTRLRNTMAARRCIGKTGTIRGVSALSGYCTGTDGGSVAFSFLENRVCPVCAKRIEDRMVRALARYAPGV
jgi:D-alanyl-D-alanine carboxypeptidase/D-alanyl-D-alanine-endopeptidase (penicillin-binding protein 4)